MEVFYGKGAPKKFPKFIRKNLCQSLYFNKVEGLRPATLPEKETPTQVLCCEFCEIFKNTNLQNISNHIETI